MFRVYEVLGLGFGLQGFCFVSGLSTVPGSTGIGVRVLGEAPEECDLQPDTVATAMASLDASDRGNASAMLQRAAQADFRPMLAGVVTKKFRSRRLC